MELARAVYKLTVRFPSSERFGLTDQLRRASVSVVSNIAEGYGRSTRGEYVQFLGHARGSNCELLTQLMLARDLEMGSGSEINPAIQLSNQVGCMLVALINKLRK